MRVVLDSGPIIHLSWIDHLDLLDTLFEEVFLPIAVCNEVLATSLETLGRVSIEASLTQGWLQIHGIQTTLPSAALGRGEMEAIILAEEMRANLLITDDAAARTLASQRGLIVTGTLGVLRAARNQALIPAVTPLLRLLRQNGFWISAKLVETIQREESEAET